MSGLAAAALAAGFLGGVHCIGMCGGIAASLSAAARGPRILAFNAGRIAAYAAAGALAGLVGIAFDAQLVLMVVANLLMLLLGLYVAGWGRVLLRLESLGVHLWRRLEPLRARVFPIDSTAKALGAGAVWGWLPCGLVYSMLGLALASGTPAGGALVMLAFGLGTLPSLLAAGYAAQRLLAWRGNLWVRRGAGMAIMAMAVVGLARIPRVAHMLEAGWTCVT